MFGWRYFDRSGGSVGISEPFDDAEAAESWLSEAWASLRERGIEEVELVDLGSDQVSYRMGLSEPEP